ncbi:MAG: DUF1016 N-terminal domain-containing protein, partial [Lentimicrobiaceae bacterium]|nr:DUF1016 N-terminal domain-containing protein [Lentimicrobiaceae bacterium]
MEKSIEQNGKQYDCLIEQIGDLLFHGRRQVAYTVNNVMVHTYWQIGKYIVEYEQGGSEKSEYGSKLLDRLSTDLTMLYGKGFSRSNLVYIRKLYIYFQIGETVSHQLSNNSVQISGTVSHQLKSKSVLSEKLNWGHYFEILKADNELEITFYTKQCEKENWSVRELKRQMKSMLFHRLAL